MSSEYVVTPIQGTPSPSAINANLNAIADALAEKLSRCPQTGNQMEDDIDINSFSIINLRFAEQDLEAVPLAQVKDVAAQVATDILRYGFVILSFPGGVPSDSYIISENLSLLGVYLDGVLLGEDEYTYSPITRQLVLSPRDGIPTSVEEFISVQVRVMPT